MISLNATELHDLAVVVATAFPVLVVAYYSAARGLIDDILRDEGSGVDGRDAYTSMDALVANAIFDPSSG